jgi:hypothetical protein
VNAIPALGLELENLVGDAKGKVSARSRRRGVTVAADFDDAAPDFQ